jgi:DNA-binding NarL/FixJ family response regulator
MFGRNHSEEAKARMSAANMGQEHPPRSESHKRAISEARRGEKNNMTKLTSEQVSEIRRLAKEGLTRTAIAGMFDTSVATISRIVTGKIWAHVA